MKRNASAIKKALTTIAIPDCQRRGRALVYVSGAVLWLLAGSCPAWADQIEMQNGDRYAGNVLSLNADNLVLQSDVLGTVRLPRTNVSVITLGATLPAASPALRSPIPGDALPTTKAPVNATTNLSPQLRQLGVSPAVIQQVQKQFLSEAGPEANGKFDELLSGLMSGKLSVGDISAQAKAAADQLRQLRREGGEEASFALDAYLSVLDHFVKENPPPPPKTNAPAPSRLSKAKPAPAEE
jgi:hypothetical protein